MKEKYTVSQLKQEEKTEKTEKQKKTKIETYFHYTMGKL